MEPGMGLDLPKRQIPLSAAVGLCQWGLRGVEHRPSMRDGGFFTWARVGAREL
jgi:hypothetical protein